MQSIQIHTEKPQSDSKPGPCYEAAVHKAPCHLVRTRYAEIPFCCIESTVDKGKIQNIEYSIAVVIAACSSTLYCLHVSLCYDFYLM